MLQNPQVLLPLALLAVATGSYVASVGSTSFVPSSVKPRRSQTTNPSARKRVTKMTTSSNTSTRDEIENYRGGDYKVFVGRGMDRFRSGRVGASISDFDTAIALQPSLTPYMWQRGLSLYYADRFEEGAKQFRRDIDVNPNDTEELIWAFLCDEKTSGVGFDKARKRLPKRINERRPYMRAAYALFLGESKEDELAMQMTKSAINDDVKSAAAYFYANLYLGLYSEAKGDDALAEKYIKAAVRSSYGKSGDYMHDVARIHEIVRGW